MNSDTQRAVAEIEKKRWYLKSTSLGDGGWPAVYQFAKDWKTYVVRWDGTGGDASQPVVAESDKVAWDFFRSYYHLPADAEVFEKIVTYRPVPKPE
jgi:hypothetical protein